MAWAMMRAAEPHPLPRKMPLGGAFFRRAGSLTKAPPGRISAPTWAAFAPPETFRVRGGLSGWEMRAPGAKDQFCMPRHA